MYNIGISTPLGPGYNHPGHCLGIVAKLAPCCICLKYLTITTYTLHHCWLFEVLCTLGLPSDPESGCFMTCTLLYSVADILSHNFQAKFPLCPTRFFFNSLPWVISLYGNMHLCFLALWYRTFKNTRLLPDLKLSQNVPNHTLFKLCKFHTKINSQFFARGQNVLYNAKALVYNAEALVYNALNLVSLHILTYKMPILQKVK